jgi:outer membrane protein assembly factor BamB
MSQLWRNLFLSLSAATLVLGSCTKSKTSTDAPLPTSYTPSIIISSDNNVLYGINPTNGSRNWELGLPNTVTVPILGAIDFKPSPLLYNEMIYQPSAFSDTIYKINSKTGTIVAKIVLPTAGLFTVESTPVASGNLIFLTTMNDSIYAFDTGTYAIKWRYSGDPSAIVSSPTVYNGNVYYGSTGGHVYCIATTGPDATSGNIIWDYPGAGNSVTPSPSFISSASISAPYLYIGSATDSNMYSLYLTPPTGTSPYTGALHWTFKTNGNIWSSPAVYGGYCIFGSQDFNTYCVDSTLGLLTWKFATNSTINSSPIIVNNVVYIASYDYNLYALTMKNGNQLWNFHTNGLIKSSPLQYQGALYVASDDGNLYCVDSAQGTLKWKYNVTGNIQSSPVLDNLTGTSYNTGISGSVN